MSYLKSLRHLGGLLRRTAAHEPSAAEASLRPITYDTREDAGGWTVYDTESEQPAHLNGVPQTGLGHDIADDLAGLLNAMEREKGTAAGH